MPAPAKAKKFLFFTFNNYNQNVGFCQIFHILHYNTEVRKDTFQGVKQNDLSKKTGRLLLNLFIRLTADYFLEPNHII